MVFERANVNVYCCISNFERLLRLKNNNIAKKIWKKKEKTLEVFPFWTASIEGHLIRLLFCLLDLNADFLAGFLNVLQTFTGPGPGGLVAALKFLNFNL